MWRVLFLILPLPALGESLVATRTIRADAVLTAADLTTVEALIPGALTQPEDAIGQEARVAIYAGRPILARAIGPAAIIDRNQLVTLVFTRAGLTIQAEGRALGRGGIGDRIQVMNLTSRNTMTGQIAPDGTVEVTP